MTTAEEHIDACWDEIDERCRDLLRALLQVRDLESLARINEDRAAFVARNIQVDDLGAADLLAVVQVSTQYAALVRMVQRTRDAHAMRDAKGQGGDER